MANKGTKQRNLMVNKHIKLHDLLLNKDINPHEVIPLRLRKELVTFLVETSRVLQEVLRVVLAKLQVVY